MTPPDSALLDTRIQASPPLTEPTGPSLLADQLADALVNNAGILRDRTLAKMTPEEWDAVVKVHLRGHYAPTHAAVNHWREEGKPGHVVCTASTSGILGNFGQSNYGAAKAGIAAFAQIVATEN